MGLIRYKSLLCLFYIQKKTHNMSPIKELANNINHLVELED